MKQMAIKGMVLKITGIPSPVLPSVTVRFSAEPETKNEVGAQNALYVARAESPNDAYVHGNNNYPEFLTKHFHNHFQT